MGLASPRFPGGKTMEAKKGDVSTQVQDYKLPKGKKNVLMSAKSKNGQNDESSPSFSNTPPATQTNKNESFSLEKAITAPSDAQLAASIEEWRGFRRPKTSKWESKNEWSGWKEWKKE